MSFAGTFHGSSYPQGMQTPGSISPGLSSTAAAYGVLLVISIYYILQYFDFTNLPLSELMWNSAVYVTPSPLINMLDKDFRLAIVEDQVYKSTGFDSKRLANKSNAMRRILRLDGAGVLTTVQRTTTLSNLSSVFKVSSKKGLPGLGNWDNSCYQNSVLQGLAALESLPEFLGRSDGTDALHPTKKALRQTIEKLNDPENVGKTFWTPADLKSMSSWQQQDAQEYFSKISDQLDTDTAKEMARTVRRDGLKMLCTEEEYGHPSGSLQSEIKDDTAVLRRTSSVAQLPEEISSLIVRNPLEGLLAQRVGCQRCGYVEGLSMVPFNCLTVSLGRQWMYDVRECLDEYTALEPISGVECAKCTLLRASQQMDRLLVQLQPRDDGPAESPKDANLTLRESVQARLGMVNQALEDEDFSDQVLKQCQIPPRQRVLTTKSRQAVVARPPKSLVIHINRSNFDEVTGMQSKNSANVSFPQQLDLAPWCLGHNPASPDRDDAIECWNDDPTKSMLDINQDVSSLARGRSYELRAVITHYGRHENGHYICYRRAPYSTKSEDEIVGESIEPWWRLSDEDVTEVDEDIVLAQGGVFMLFYEQVEPVTFEKEDPPKVAEQVVEQMESEPLDEVRGATLENAASESPSPVSLLEPVLEKQPATVAYPTPPMSPQALDMSEYSEEAVDQSQITPLMPKLKVLEKIGTSVTSVPEQPSPITVSKDSEPRATSPSSSEETQSSVSSGRPSSDTPIRPTEQAPSTPVAKENQSLSPVSMRTAGPRSGRGSVSRAGRAMGSVAGFVQAN